MEASLDKQIPAGKKSLSAGIFLSVIDFPAAVLTRFLSIFLSKKNENEEQAG